MCNLTFVSFTCTELKGALGTLCRPIIPGFLYLGSYDSASRSELLKTMGITHILNVSVQCSAQRSNLRLHARLVASAQTWSKQRLVKGKDLSAALFK